MAAESPGQMVDDGRSDPEIIGLARRIGLQLQANVDNVSSEMTRAIEDAIGELNDPDMLTMLQESVDDNVEAITSMLVDEVPPDQVPPLPKALRYAVALAQGGVSGSALRRAYHIGSDYLLTRIFQLVEDLECEPGTQLLLFHHLARWTFRYVDQITRVVLDAYEQERRNTDERFATTTAAYISRVLAEQHIHQAEFDSATGYRLDQIHVAALMWFEDASPAIDQADTLFDIANQLRDVVKSFRAPLMTAVDRKSARVWFGHGHNLCPVDVSAVTRVIERTNEIRIAFGAPNAGAMGFRTTLRQAEHVATIPRNSDSPHGLIVAYSDETMPIIARLAENIATTRQWIHEVLGTLADDSDHAERQRETLRVFFDTAGSFTNTADRMMMHRNSIKYRVQRAEDELGRPLTERRLDTQLSLKLCHTLGSGVLQG